MGCSASDLASASPRISARSGQVVDLNVDFYRNGVLTNPYAIRYVEIYKTQVLPHNLVATIPISELDNILYPAPLCQEEDTSVGNCGTESSSGVIEGKYHLLYAFPVDFTVPDVYFDVWYYFPENPCGALGTDVTTCDLDDPAYASLLQKCCHRFWAYPDDWFCNDKLQTVRFGFEPLDQKFYQPENRPLEVGLMPLPLYDYNFNLVHPLIPFIRPTITVETFRRELLVDKAPCRIGVRQGSFKANPFVIQYDLDTTAFLFGTYTYYITLTLPDGSTRVSRKFIFTVA